MRGFGRRDAMEHRLLPLPPQSISLYVCVSASKFMGLEDDSGGVDCVLLLPTFHFGNLFMVSKGALIDGIFSLFF